MKKRSVGIKKYLVALQIQKMSEAPSDMEVGTMSADMVLHASLSVGTAMLFGSDAPAEEYKGPCDMSVSITVDTVEDVQRVFDALARNGQAIMAVGEVFWSPAFAMRKDEFGVPWMVGAAH